MRKKSKKSSLKKGQTEPPTVEGGNAGSRPVIGILLWNSSIYQKKEKEFLSLLKKNIENAGGTAFFYPVSGGADFFETEDLDSIFSSAATASGNGSKPTMLHNYSLPARDLIADQIEVLTQTEPPEGLLMIPWSISSMVGMLMGSVRCRIPTLFFPHYPAFPMFCSSQKENQKKKAFPELFYSQFSFAVLLEAMGLARIGTLETALTDLLQTIKLNKKKNLRKEIVETAASTISESLGESLQWNAARIVEMARQKITPKRFFSTASFHNALAADCALGGSAETILHLTALAREAEVALTPSFINEMAEKVLPLVPFKKTGEYSLQDFLEDGGSMGLFTVLQPFLKPSPTVSGKNIVELAKMPSRKRLNFKLNKPTKKIGALTVLSGNLAREGALFRVAGIKESYLVYSGTVKVFDREEECIKAIFSKKIKSGMILVLRYYGPKGCPGMPSLSAVARVLKEKKLDEQVAIVTDGRIHLSGKTPSIVHLSPEAAVGSPLSVVQDGDEIFWDFYKKTITLRVTDTEIKVRLSRWREQERNMKNSFLSRYCKYAAPSSLGATLA